MHARLFGSVMLAAVIGCSAPAYAIKKVPYPEVKVTPFEAHNPDPSFQAVRNAFRQAATKKDANALFALLGPTFVWTVQGALAADFDLGRDALHNFKVVFGFRKVGQDADGGVQDGPFWDALIAFAEDGTYYSATDNDNLICSPIGADVENDDVFEQATEKLETPDEGVDWYFTLREVPVAKTRGDTGPPITKVNKVALPVIGTFPPQGEAGAAPPAFMEVLLRDGKSGWVPAAALRPLNSERLCYAKTAKGEWKIVAYDQLETEEESADEK